MHCVVEVATELPDLELRVVLVAIPLEQEDEALRAEEQGTKLVVAVVGQLCADSEVFDYGLVRVVVVGIGQVADIADPEGDRAADLAHIAVADYTLAQNYACGSDSGIVADGDQIAHPDCSPDCRISEHCPDADTAHAFVAGFWPDVQNDLEAAALSADSNVRHVQVLRRDSMYDFLYSALAVVVFQAKHTVPDHGTLSEGFGSVPLLAKVLLQRGQHCEGALTAFDPILAGIALR
jgi:hypothetical protein